VNRRHFLGWTAAIMAAPATLLAAGNQTIEYTPGLIEQKLTAGETVLVDYAAAWCSTCKRQERVIAELRAANPAFDENITFVRVDWDEYRSQDVVVDRKIPRRSTLILLRGDQELGRIIAGTRKDEIKALLELGLVES
jgi:thioredoxin 1